MWKGIRVILSCSLSSMDLLLVTRTPILFQGRLRAFTLLGYWPCAFACFPVISLSTRRGANRSGPELLSILFRHVNKISISFSSKSLQTYSKRLNRIFWLDGDRPIGPTPSGGGWSGGRVRRRSNPCGAHRQGPRQGIESKPLDRVGCGSNGKQP